MKCIFLGIFVQFLGELHLQAAQPQGLVEAKFVSEQRVLVPGKMLTIGLHLKMKENYHTYWKFPGIVGLPTSLSWRLPEGFSASEIHWPTPQRVKMASYQVNGFRNEVLLLVDIEVPKEIAETEVELKADAAWMCCWKTCHPGFATVSLTLPVAGEEEENPHWKQKFREVRALWAQPIDGWKISVEQVESGFTLKGTPQKNGGNLVPQDVVFYSEDGQVCSHESQEITIAEDGSFVMRLPKSEFAPEGHTRLLGVLYSSAGWEGRNPLKSLKVDVPFD